MVFLFFVIMRDNMKLDSFLSIGFGILSGIILGMFLPSEIVGQYIHWIILGVIVWIYLLKKLIRVQSIIWILCITSFAIIIGFWRTDQFHKKYPFNSFDQFHNKTITVVGTIHGVPTLKPGKQSIRIKPEFINGIKIPHKTLDIVIATTDLEKVTIGDRMVVSGKFSLRENFLSDSGRTVQYRLMSYSKKIVGDIRYPNIEKTVHTHTRTIENIFYKIKNYFIKTLNQIYIAPVSGLLSGIVVGDTSSLDNSLLETFRLVGLIHIVVLSGYNVTLVANSFVRLFSSLGYYRRLITAMIALSLFILIVGISPTSSRAGVMALSAFAAKYFIKPYVITRGILLALLVMTWISPYAILFDLSLQLSFLATIGIVYIFPVLQERYERFAENSFGEILLQTLSVNIMTLPLIIYQMGYFSFISFPINILVLGLIPWITIFGFLSVFIGMILLPLGQIIAFPIQIAIDGIIRLSTWTSLHDPLQMTFNTFSVYWMLGIYFCIIGVIVYFTSRRS